MHVVNASRWVERATGCNWNAMRAASERFAGKVLVKLSTVDDEYYYMVYGIFRNRIKMGIDLDYTLYINMYTRSDGSHAACEYVCGACVAKIVCP